MNTVTISPKFQVVIPQEVREELGLPPGQRVQAIAHEGRIEFVLLHPLSEMRGYVRGMDTELDRDEDRDLDDSAERNPQ
jgi:AbrB family looped-hinge helix DNA binding protein